MDKSTLAKILAPILSPFLPSPGVSETGGGGLFSGINPMAMLDGIKMVQSLMSQGEGLPGYLADQASPELLSEIEQVLLEAGYKKG